MVSDEEMRSGNILNLFWKFALPAVVGVVIAGIQGIIDGFFIGNVIGSQGLAGITLAYPPYIAIIGVGVIIGIGVVQSHSPGTWKGKYKGSPGYCAQCFSLMSSCRSHFYCRRAGFLRNLNQPPWSQRACPYLCSRVSQDHFHGFGFHDPYDCP